MMFYHYPKGYRVPVDLDNTYEGQSCFLAGGSPTLLNEDLTVLDQPGITVMAMNNTASVVPTQLWVGGDKPMCYSPRILLDGRMKHFGVISRRDFEVAGLPWKHLPNTYFFGTKESFTLGTFLNPDRDVAWWKNTFYMALQIAYRLGFRKIYLIGCQFKIETDAQYAYVANLSDKQVNWNKRTYSGLVANMKHLKPHFEQHGLEIISCTPDSPLNDIYRNLTLPEATKEILQDFPQDYDTQACPHSSVFGEQKEK